MKPKILLRVATGFILFFVLGHTMGHFTWKQTTDPKKQVIIKMMDENEFEFGGAMKSIGENHEGYSWLLIFSLLAFAMLTWVISGLTEKDSKASVNLLIPVFACFFAFAIICYLFFFLVPAATCLLASMLMLISILQLKKVS